MLTRTQVARSRPRPRTRLKAKAKDSSRKAKAKDLQKVTKAKAKDLTFILKDNQGPRSRPTTNITDGCYVNRLPSWLTIRIWSPGKSPKYRRSMKIVITLPFLKL